MNEVKISSKFQVVIPKGVRQQLNLKAGQKMQLITKGNTITLVPIYPFGTLRGTLNGMDILVIREDGERL